MKRASELFDDERRKQIDAAVVDAERQTAAEIVPVVATASGRYDRPEDMAGLAVAIVALWLAWLLVPQQTSQAGSWWSIPPALQFAIYAAATIGGFMLGSALAMLLPPVRRALTPRSQMRDEVLARASQVFFDHRVHHTDSQAGLLIYLSLYERMAAVLADERVLEKLGQPALDELCDRLTAELRAADPTAALCNTIRDAGQRLASVLPAQETNPNEIADALVTID